jgi:hypothetical protein
MTVNHQRVGLMVDGPAQRVSGDYCCGKGTEFCREPVRPLQRVSRAISRQKWVSHRPASRMWVSHRSRLSRPGESLSRIVAPARG